MVSLAQFDQASIGCVADLLAAHSADSTHLPAILSSRPSPLTFGRLYQWTNEIVQQLNGLGIGRNDRVAIVLPNGPEMACAFLAISAGATAAPLNPNYRAKEFEFYLNDLQAQAIVVLDGHDSPARVAAKANRVPIIEVTPKGAGPCGLFSLYGQANRKACNSGFAQPTDVALILHTSGTTARPKIVPLLQRNIVASARSVGATLQLTPHDRGLNVMPLFHIHGLIAGLMAPLMAGGSVVCTTGFQTAPFFEWLQLFSPTWYTAVPTIHQAVLQSAGAYPVAIQQSSLRLIRSSSAALPPSVMAKLENLFCAPVIEAYGMTEAAHQMASNPLPPRTRKPGSVGIPAGPEMAILDEAGRRMAAGAIGEIAIRGTNVMPGYEKNAGANAISFTHGWFRTGDQGFYDEEGYFFITGRIKELINRGGEKISPREVDEVLIEHPAVAQAVTFAVPHVNLGENVAAAVVLASGQSATENDLREFACQRLAEFKVPYRILLVAELPKGPTGKVQRNGLAERFGLPEHEKSRSRMTADDSPVSPLEESLALIWKQVLGIAQIGVHDNFFELGGDSIGAAMIMERIERTHGRRLSIVVLFQAPTISRLADQLRSHELGASTTTLVPVQPHGLCPPFFCLHPPGISLFYNHRIAQHIGNEQPVYDFACSDEETARNSHDDVVRIATRYLVDLRKMQIEGPYFLGGYSFGGVLAFEMAHQLRAQGQEVALLALIDSACPRHAKPLSPPERIRSHLRYLRGLERREQLRYLWPRVSGWTKSTAGRVGRVILNPGEKLSKVLGRLARESRNQVQNEDRTYEPELYSGRATLIRAKEHLEAIEDPYLGWDKVVTGGIDICVVPGNKDTLMHEQHIRRFIEGLKQCLLQAAHRHMTPIRVESTNDQSSKRQ